MGNKKRILARKAAGLTENQREDLLFGGCLLFPPDPCFEWREGERVEHRPFANEEARREAWVQNRDFLMSLIGKPKDEGGIPWGTRPKAFYDYEATEPFRITGYKPVPDVWRNLEWIEPYPIYETELDFLDRHGLLFPNERAEAESQEWARAERIERLRQETLKDHDSDEDTGND
jgi:hypothetical protein